AALSALPPRSLSVTVEAADLGHLPAAVEVAAYQITAEALTNVRRHAVARCCTIRLDVDDGWLEVEVTDDGIGLAPDFREGVGLACMRERASDLGGSVSVEAAPERGTRVYVEIPVGNQ
ncbi:MAG: two-component system, NarL family, sensor kinase, partial [Acidimicrobiaceae bacterium]|nr:two-component system, NarL family, sensor kinase [Acidimicrobiaceae bacterium]